MTPPPPIPLDVLLAQVGWVRRLAQRLAHDAQSADDLTQGALTAAIEKPPGGDRPLRPWLARVVTNLARKERRGAARRAERERQHARFARSVPATDQLMAELEEQHRIARLVDELREPYRTVLLLHYYHGQPAGEIAQAQGVSAATLRSQLARGLALLRGRLEAQHGGDSRRALGVLLVAAGARDALPQAAGLSSTTTTALAFQKLLVMNSGTKILAASVACAIVVTGVLGLRALDNDDSLSPAATPTVEDPGATIQSDARIADTGPNPADGGRTSLAEVTPASAPATEDEPPPAPEEPGPTTFVARAVDGDGLPVSGAAFAIVTEEGRPRSFGVATTSGLDGRVEIVVEKEAFFTYMGREESNTYMSLCAPDHAAHFFVPAAKRGTNKDLGDIVLAPGSTVTGRVIDVAGAPIEGAVVVGTASFTSGDIEAARIAGPDREGGRPTAITDHLGRFTLAGVHVGQVLVWASDTGTLWSKSDTLDVFAGEVLPGVELVLEELPRSARVAGLVIDPQGAPVPGALIRHGTPGGWGEEKLHADSAGAFLIPAPVDTPFRIMAADPKGELGSSAEQYVKAGDVELRLVLPERRTLRIRVARASDGEPIEGASVISAPLQDQQFFMNSDWEHSDADGLLELPVPGEPFRVSVGHTSFEYRRFGPFEPAALPEEVFAELKQKPMINGVVLAGREPVPGARIELVQSCEARFRPLYNGFPLRLFDGGIEQATTDAEGRFSLPTNEHASDPPVLLVTKEGYALTELLLDLPEPTAGADDVEVQMNAGGALEGHVLVGPKRNPESVVVILSRGDGRPKLTRPDASGYYLFERLTPGQWRVEDRDAEPEGRVFGMAQGDEHPFRWDCEVRVGETTEYDLDLRWQDDLRVEGRLTFDGEGAAGWIAVLEAPDHSDRPWPARPVTLGEDGSYSLEARPGYAKLVLRAPLDGPLKMMLQRELLIDQHLEPAVFAFETAGLAGTLAEGALKLRLFHRIDETTHVEATFESGVGGRVAIDGFVAGPASFQHHREAAAGQYGAGWYPRGQVELKAGEILQVE